MLDEIDPLDFQRLWALSILDGWGDPWSHTGTIAAEVHNAALRICAAQGARIKESDAKLPGDYERTFSAAARKRNEMTIDAFEAWSRSNYG